MCFTTGQHTRRDRAPAGPLGRQPLRLVVMEGRLLLVEDDPQVRAMLTRALGYEGFEIVTAGDAASAMSAFRAGRPDLLLLDLLLPDDDGVDVCRRLRDAGDQVPILMLTARDTVGGPHRRPGGRGRRLPGEAVLDRRAGGAGARPAAPGARPRRWAPAALRGPDPRRVHPRGAPRRPPAGADPPRVRPARPAARQPGRGDAPRAPPDRRVGLLVDRRDQLGGRLRGLPAPQARGGRRAAPDPHRARGGLRAAPRARSARRG